MHGNESTLVTVFDPYVFYASYCTSIHHCASLWCLTTSKTHVRNVKNSGKILDLDYHWIRQPLMLDFEFPATENAFPDEICQILDKLQVLLDNIPVHLVEEDIERSAFALLVFYEPDRELMEDLGCEFSVLN